MRLREKRGGAIFLNLIKVQNFYLPSVQFKQQSQVTVVNRFSKLSVVRASDVILSILLLPQ